MGNHRLLGVAALVAGLAMVAGCGPSIDENELRPKAREALLNGVAGLMTIESVDIGDLWAVKQILQIHPDENLQNWFDAAVAAKANEPLELLVNPDANRTLLPMEPGQGSERFVNAIYAPCGRPETRARRFVEEFAATDEAGYVLAHQIITIDWSGQTGLELSAETVARKEVLWARLLEEQEDDYEFSDLFAERAALLQAYGDPPHGEVLRWIDAIVTAQTPNGTWVDRTTFTSLYDGEEIKTKPWRAHTTVLALWALAEYFHGS